MRVSEELLHPNPQEHPYVCLLHSGTVLLSVFIGSHGLYRKKSCLDHADFIPKLDITEQVRYNLLYINPLLIILCRFI